MRRYKKVEGLVKVYDWGEVPGRFVEFYREVVKIVVGFGCILEALLDKF